MMQNSDTMYLRQRSVEALSLFFWSSNELSFHLISTENTKTYWHCFIYLLSFCQLLQKCQLQYYSVIMHPEIIIFNLIGKELLSQLNDQLAVLPFGHLRETSVSISKIGPVQCDSETADNTKQGYNPWSPEEH